MYRSLKAGKPLTLEGRPTTVADGLAAPFAGAPATAAEDRYRLALLQAEDALDGALGAVRDAAARLESAQTAVTHLTDVTRIELLSLQAGAGTEVEYLRAEADARQARAELATAHAAAITARVRLAQLTGELSLDWLAQAVEDVP